MLTRRNFRRAAYHFDSILVEPHGLSACYTFDRFDRTIRYYVYDRRPAMGLLSTFRYLSHRFVGFYASLYLTGIWSDAFTPVSRSLKSRYLLLVG
jgi:hypothetical protein